MNAYFGLSFRFLDAAFHGRLGELGGEWPPSPLRAFQALVAAAAARWSEQEIGHAKNALNWLERQPPPRIIVPQAMPASSYRLYVPDNTADLVAKSWRGGGDADVADFRSEKDVRPTLMLNGDTITFLWSLPDPIPDDIQGHIDILSMASRSVVAVGWGVDMVASNGRVLSDEQAAALPGERWSPADGKGGTPLRVPVKDTLAGLSRRHAAFLRRLDGGVLTPVPPLSAFRVQTYRRASDPGRPPFAAFALLQPDNEKTAFFAVAHRTACVAGMLRHAVAEAAKRSGRGGEWVATYVLGHDAGGGKATGGLETRRFSYLPMPTIHAYDGKRRLGGIQRVMIAAPPGDEGHIAWARRTLAGAELKDHSGTAHAVLSLLPNEDFAVKGYAKGSARWASVTPVILPGRDDGKAAKAERLLLRSLHHAGLPAPAEMHWRPEPFWPGAEHVKRHLPFLPSCYLHPVCYHVKLRFDKDIPGPIALGAGRYGGFGTFACGDAARQLGTPDGLAARSAAFLRRLEGGVLTPVLPLSAFRVQPYRRADDPAPMSFAAFALLRPDNRGMMYFDPARRCLHVAGMMRHAVDSAAKEAGRSSEWRAAYVQGHDPSGGPARGGLEGRRFSYLPMPSVLAFGGKQRLGGIQRVMVAAPPGDEAEVAWLRRALSGRELRDEGGKVVAVMSLLPNDDWAVGRYAGRGKAWASVTPVLLPGRDDGRAVKTERLLRRSLEHAGLPAGASLSWRREGYWVGSECATQHVLPKCHVNPVRYHVRVEWGGTVRGPLAVGAGRYGGFGLFALDAGEAGW